MKIIKKVDKSELRKFMYHKFSECADDPKLYEALNSGKAINVFQMSAGTASQVVNQIHPDNLLEMTACNAFARPGTIDGVPNYVDGKSGRLKYKNAIINSVFGETFGVCLFQEQIMSLFVKIGGHTDGGNYIRGLLKKLGKANKKQEDIDAWKEETRKFSENALKMGIPQNELKALLEDVAALANYSFNKSHALAYSMMAAWTLYLNVYFKKFYYPAVIEYAFDHDKETLETLKDMRSNGFKIIPPNVNTSKDRTYSTDDEIYIGLHNVKQVGNAAESICERGPYKHFSDFLKKNLMDSKINKRVMTALVEFGCFDELEPSLTRHQMISCFSQFWETKPVIKRITAAEAEKIKSDKELQEKLLSAIHSKIDGIVEYWDKMKASIERNEFAAKDTRQFKKELEAKYLGFNFFISPFDAETNKFINDKVALGKCVSSFNDVRKFKDVSKVVPVYISSIREYKDKNGNNMGFLSLEDRTGDEITVPVFASCYQFVADKLSPDYLALMLLYNTDDSYHGGQQIMFGTKKWIAPEKYASFIIPLRRGQ